VEILENSKKVYHLLVRNFDKEACHPEREACHPERSEGPLSAGRFARRGRRSFAALRM